MSLEVNTQLYERAAAMIDLWEGTPMARMLEADIDRGDLDTLNTHVCRAEAQAAQEEFEATDVL